MVWESLEHKVLLFDDVVGDRYDEDNLMNKRYRGCFLNTLDLEVYRRQEGQ